MKTKLVIFDCDGVLVDSEPISNAVIAEELTNRGLATSLEESLKLFAGGDLKNVGIYFQQQTGTTIGDDFISVYRKKTAIAFAERLEAVEGVEAMLQQLPIQKCVGSNGPLHKIKSNLEKTGLTSFFGDRLYSAYDIQHWKPEPHLYLHAAKENGRQPAECVVVEDSIHGVEAAIAAGMCVFAYTGTKPGQLLQEAGAIPFDHMHQLPDLILN